MKKFIVLDVEGYSTCRPYDVGYIVGNKAGEVFEEKSYAFLPAVWDNICYKFEKEHVKGLKEAHEMAHRNIEEILNDNDNKYNRISDTNVLFNDLLRAITEHKIKRIWAYNCSFDKSALRRLFTSEQWEIINNLVTFCDIIPAILYTRLLNENYVNFCKENGFMTDKGNVRTKAETVYRYLTNNLEFEEAHTGLADVRIEYEILRIAMQSTKNPKYKPCQAWKVIQRFCEAEGIYIPALD